MKYYVRDREAGNIIEECANLKQAKELVKQYESDDKKDGIFTPDFYEIINENNEIIYK